MATYAIGDIQGCYTEFRLLLNAINFNAEQDILWLCGDLVNRGPNSLDVLRYVSNLKNKIVVLGNHDLHLLAVHAHPSYLNKSDTFQDVLNAVECDELCNWLRHQSLFYHDASLNYSLLHAGLPPQWDLIQAQHCAQEAEAALRGLHYKEFLQQMYGNQPSLWTAELSGIDRLRFIVNCFTRLRFCDEAGAIHLEYKGALGSQPSHLLPWYEISWRLSNNMRILFGHWAALEGKVRTPNVIALDSGCVWGGQLSALCLEESKIYQVSCPTYAKY